jgi:tRNA pseudouridine38-40 synthase
VRFAIGIEYDGRTSCGWQTQPSGCSVQDRLERAIGNIAGHVPEVVAAGRTDAGVHALAQVAHFDTDVDRPLNAWVRGVNGVLPEGIAVLWVQPVSDDFHARFKAEERCYRYILLNHPVRPALFSGLTGWHHAPLDVERMRAGAAHLLGRHDFSAFRAAGCQAASPIKELRQISVERWGDFIVMDFRADGFLHHMVRNVVGALVRVGDGRDPADHIHEVLQGRDRTRAAPTFMPDGLYFAGAKYPAFRNLPLPTPRVPWLDR